METKADSLSSCEDGIGATSSAASMGAMLDAPCLPSQGSKHQNYQPLAFCMRAVGRNAPGPPVAVMSSNEASTHQEHMPNDGGVFDQHAKGTFPHAGRPNEDEYGLSR